jgi:hypothetical protein
LDTHWLPLLVDGHTVPHVGAQPKFMADRFAAQQHENLIA